MKRGAKKKILSVRLEPQWKLVANRRECDRIRRLLLCLKRLRATACVLGQLPNGILDVISGYCAIFPSLRDAQFGRDENDVLTFDFLIQSSRLRDNFDFCCSEYCDMLSWGTFFASWRVTYNWWPQTEDEVEEAYTDAAEWISEFIIHQVPIEISCVQVNNGVMMHEYDLIDRVTIELVKTEWRKRGPRQLAITLLCK